MKVHFYLDRRKEKVHRLPIFMHFWYKGKLLRIYTGEHCNQGDWDLERERIIPDSGEASEINRLLQSIEEEVLSIVRSARINRIPVDIGYIRDHLTFLTSHERGFFNVWEEFVIKESVEKEWGTGMVRRFDILKMHLKILDKQSRINFHTVNDKFYHRFIEYHLQQGFQKSYAARNLELFRWFMNWATLNGYNMKMTYKNFKQPEEKHIIYKERFLTADELIKLYKLNTDHDLMESVKDVFCFGCLTGLRYTDIIKLEEKHLSDTKLIYTRKKPKIEVEIPLIDMAREILEKYRSGNNGIIFPDTPIQIFNKSLKQLGKLAGLTNPVTIKYIDGNGSVKKTYKKWELLSSKFTKWTFLNLGVKMGIGLEVMSELTGNRPGTLRNYYQMKKYDKNAEMQKLNTFF
jgi:site-specific recombinase XerD